MQQVLLESTCSTLSSILKVQSFQRSHGIIKIIFSQQTSCLYLLSFWLLNCTNTNTSQVILYVRNTFINILINAVGVVMTLYLNITRFLYLKWIIKWDKTKANKSFISNNIWLTSKQFLWSCFIRIFLERETAYDIKNKM